ncbi:hypothetical protein LTR84_002759 [Exophiala bonariae]|uniref:Cytochrome P450 n=1 Tax=Exophiala bonariae TaxID=1690606 RepID=A0AAV9N8T5_9EURO|nr:hypothetical protein LTR84_002759 [Exophiala bonariae]
MSLWVVIGVLAVFGYPIWTMVALYRNYRLAQGADLPILISPVNPFNPLWILSRPYLNPLLSRLPGVLSQSTRYNYLGWAWRDKNYLHTLHGPAFIIVTPGENQLIVGGADACDDLFKRYREWPKNPAFNDPLNTFGPSVGTAEGDAWKRQRKITTAAFNERNSSLVWSEAVKQARQMLHTWVSTRGNEVTSTTEDTSLFALHVLTGAGFGISYDFDSSLKVPSHGHTVSYRDALRTVMDNIFITYFIASAGGLPSFILPQKARDVLTAVNEFRSYMSEMVTQERNQHRKGEGASTANLMSSIIRASDDAAREFAAAKATVDASKAPSLRASLTDSEIWGNLFIYNVAGHETTAGALAYAIGLLACHPEWQDWLQPELNQVFGNGSVNKDQYHDAFQQLKRCHAIMYETLRLYAPLNGIPRHTGSSYQVLKLGASSHTIPPNTAVFINNAAVQVDREIWSSDALAWRPGRWLQTQTENPKHTAQTKPESADTPIAPVDKAYIPWAAGPRVCPGKKFSQVEFVAAIAVLFHQYRVTPIVDTYNGETEAFARERTMQVLADSDMALAMRMNHPERLRLRWDKISGSS